MISDRYRQWVFIAFMTLFMSTAVSGVLTVWNGYVGSFVTAWLAAFVRAYIVVVPAVVVTLPLSRRLTALIVRGPKES